MIRGNWKGDYLKTKGRLKVFKPVFLCEKGIEVGACVKRQRWRCCSRNGLLRRFASRNDGRGGDCLVCFMDCFVALLFAMTGRGKVLEFRGEFGTDEGGLWQDI